MSTVRVNPLWLRNVRRLLYALIGTSVMVGLGVTWRAAWTGDILLAIVGSAATLAALGAGVMWAAALRVGLATIRSGRRLHRLERTVVGISDLGNERDRHLDELTDELERTRQEAAEQYSDVEAKSAQHRRRLVERLEGLLARVETFSKLHDEQAERLERRVTALESPVQGGAVHADLHTFEDRDWAVEDTPPGERTVAAYQHLVAQSSSFASGGGPDDAAERSAIRQEFTGLIHRREYAGALSKGDEIVRRFPASSAATDFRRVRPHLIRRIELAQRAEQATRRSAR